MNARIHGPIPLVGRRPFGADGERGMQANRFEDRIENMAAHITKRAGAEVDAFAPIDRMIITIADVRTFGANS